MPPPTSDPKDVDTLDSIARRMRTSSRLDVDEDDGSPKLGAVDVFADESAVTVTAETRNAEARHVHVSLLDGHLLINLGEGPTATRRDLALPAAVDEETAVATFRNGILDVVLPLKRA